MNSLVPQNFGPVSTRFQGVDANDDLSSGIQSSFGLIGYKGKVWSIRYRGEETQLMRDDGDGPRGSIEVVVLKSAKQVSKVWYEEGYVEGSNAAPDCYSNNGVTPEPTSAKKQCESCAVCPHNQWGSRVTNSGKGGKACADSKRLAILPLGDLENAEFGGPMLLRVPAASLQDLSKYGEKMNQMGYPYFAVGTRIAFDPAESYPKFSFNAIRPLSDEEADKIIAAREGHTVERILSENEFAAAPAGGQQATPKPEDVFEQPPQPEAKAEPKQASVGEQARAVAAEQKAAQAQKKAAPPVEPVAERKSTGFGAAKTVTPEVKAEEPTTIDVQANLPLDTPEESDEDRELREMEEKMAALKAKKAAAAKAEEAPKAEVKAETKPDPAPESSNVASDFENDLDAMLNDLLPTD